MAGRPPKPTALKLIAGNPGKRASGKQEPDPTYLRDLTPPAWMPPAVAEVWNEIAKPLSEAKLLTEVDVPMLSMACVSIAQYRYAVSRVGSDLVKSKLEKNEEGELVAVGEHINPWAMVQSMTFKQATVVLREFGMSPSARSRVAIQPQGDLFGQGNKAAGYFSS